MLNVLLVIFGSFVVQHVTGLHAKDPPGNFDMENATRMSACMFVPKKYTYARQGVFSNCPIQMTQAKWNKTSWDGKVFMIHDGAGRFGNQLFYAAATLVAAANQNRPVLILKSKLGWGLGELPCLQSTAGLEKELASGICNDWPEEELLKQDGIETSGCLAKMKSNQLVETVTNGGYQQSLALWGKDPESFFPMLREAFSVQPVVADLPDQPGPHDLVLQFRSLKANLIDTFNQCERLSSPPVEFFKHAIERHQSISSGQRDGRVWVVVTPAERTHPTVQRLVREHRVVVYSAGDNLTRPWLYDFAWLSAARHVATSCSTFGWWATVIGDPKTVYFPIMPMKVPMPWCGIMPKARQYIYDDWWAGNAYSARNNQTELAVQACSRYERHGSFRLQLDRLYTFYPELTK